MKYFKLVLFFVSVVAFSQDSIVKHVIEKGETITSIAAKYDIKTNTIFKLNPEAKGVLKLKSVLLIPIYKAIETSTLHTVLPKETLYGISKQYKVSIETIKTLNPIIEKEGLEIGLILTIPIKAERKIITQEPVKSQPNVSKQIPDERISRVVLPKETKYGIARQYGISVQELERQNPEIVSGLPVGFSLNISGSKNIVVNVENPFESKKNSTNVPEKEIKKDPVTIEEEENNKDVVSTKVIVSEVPPLINLPLAESLISRASENIGTRYRSGGTKPGGFDCSGLMIYTFENSEIKLPRTSSEQSNFGKRVEPLDAQKGDLIFFSTNGSGSVNHVGMITDVVDGEIKFIHSSVHSGVIISSNKESYYAKRFVKINRVLE